MPAVVSLYMRWPQEGTKMPNLVLQGLLYIIYIILDIYMGSHKRQACTGCSPYKYIHTYIHTQNIHTCIYTHTGKIQKTNKSNTVLTNTHTKSKQKFFKFIFKNDQGADNTSYGTEFQRNTEFTKKEYR